MSAGPKAALPLPAALVVLAGSGADGPATLADAGAAFDGLLQQARVTAQRQPIVGVPDPIAIAKMCSAVIPFPASALTVGSVTDATVLPACSGTEAK
jgi:hypothetical protein